MRLYKVCLPQSESKYYHAKHFLGEIISLPHLDDSVKGRYRYFTHPSLLEAQLVATQDGRQPRGGFTGIQLNIYPHYRIHKIIETIRATGLMQPDPNWTNGALVASVQDPTGNVILLMGHKEMPDEPLMNRSIGSVSLFVSNVARNRSFYEKVMGLPFKVAPYPGLVVFGEPNETALMLYQVPRGNPNAPIGRQTNCSFLCDDLPGFIDALRSSEGTLVEQTLREGTEQVYRIQFRDPEGNLFEAFDSSQVDLPEPLPAEEWVDDEEGSPEGQRASGHDDDDDDWMYDFDID